MFPSCLRKQSGSAWRAAAHTWNRGQNVNNGPTDIFNTDLHRTIKKKKKRSTISKILKIVYYSWKSIIICLTQRRRGGGQRSWGRRARQGLRGWRGEGGRWGEEGGQTGGEVGEQQTARRLGRRDEGTTADWGRGKGGGDCEG